MRASSRPDRPLFAKARITGKWAALALISVAELLVLSLWFSASAIAPDLVRQWHLGPIGEAFLTSGVQLGFVAGALVSAWIGLADRVDPRRLFFFSALLGAAANGAFVLSGGLAAGVVFRVLTGVGLAGVYPVAVKLLAEWFIEGRGLAMGILIGSLTLGSALPRLVVYWGAAWAWPTVVLASSAMAVVGALLVWVWLGHPPGKGASAPVSWRLLPAVLANRPVMLANMGYFGHMWELYAMWTWLPVFLSERFAGHGLNGAAHSALWAFVVIGVAGVIGSVAGGQVADYVGRTGETIGSLAISGLSALTMGVVAEADGPAWLLLTVAIIWGMAVIADSAQFSAAVTELSPPAMQGTALTFQMAVGFLVTIVSINVVPLARTWAGWGTAFAVLAAGPAVGIWAMRSLRRDPVSRSMAGGRR